MSELIPGEVLTAFTSFSSGKFLDSPAQIQVQPISGGLINRSYKVSCPQQPDFLLQRINKNVFHRPYQVQQNYISIWEYASFGLTSLRLPAPLPCGELSTLFVDDQENYWRAFEFIENTVMYSVAQSPEQVKATAAAFARFTAAFDQFNLNLLKNVIPGFHDLSLRYRQFEEALNGDCYERIGNALPLINELKQRAKYKHFYESITGSGEFSQRVMHHDAKLSNVLFDAVTGQVICIVDFDTVMPGYYFSDLGDMIRSMISSEDENSTSFGALAVRKEFYDAIIQGYLEVIEDRLSSTEKKYIHYAGPLMIYMQALRFLTDHLNRDSYYRVAYAEQNLDRAKNQLILLQKLEELLKRHYNFGND